MNPYEVLGLKPGVDYKREVIELAHRHARKKYHPDRKGGSEELMTQANMARDILLNPERKQRFDKTGSTESGPLSIEEQATLIIGNLFASAIGQLDIHDPNLRTRLFAAIGSKIIEGQQAAKQALRDHPNKLKVAKKVLKSIDCDPFLKTILEKKVEELEKEELLLNQQNELGERMIKLLQSVRFK